MKVIHGEERRRGGAPYIAFTGTPLYGSRAHDSHQSVWRLARLRLLSKRGRRQPHHRSRCFRTAPQCGPPFLHSAACSMHGNAQVVVQQPRLRDVSGLFIIFLMQRRVCCAAATGRAADERIPASSFQMNDVLATALRAFQQQTRRAEGNATTGRPLSTTRTWPPV